MKEIKNGLLTGLTLQLAIGPVFFFITNLVLQKSIYDGFAGVLAVTLVDTFYITLSILGIGKLMKNERLKKIFGFTSSLVLIVFGVTIIKGILTNNITNSTVTPETNIISSFISVFLITISSPMTIVFFTSLFTAKAVEYNYTKTQLTLFGVGTASATFLFMSFSVIFFSFIKGAVPLLLIQTLNIIVAVLLIGYGSFRLYKVIKINK